MKFTKLAGLALLVLTFGLVACQKGPAEEAGERIDNTAEELGDRAEELGDKVEEKTDY